MNNVYNAIGSYWEAEMMHIARWLSWKANRKSGVSFVSFCRPVTCAGALSVIMADNYRDLSAVGGCKTVHTSHLDVRHDLSAWSSVWVCRCVGGTPWQQGGLYRLGGFHHVGFKCAFLGCDFKVMDHNSYT